MPDAPTSKREQIAAQCREVVRMDNWLAELEQRERHAPGRFDPRERNVANSRLDRAVARLAALATEALSDEEKAALAEYVAWYRERDKAPRADACACRRLCLDVGDVDGPGVCKGLPCQPEPPLVELTTIDRREATDAT